MTTSRLVLCFGVGAALGFTLGELWWRLSPTKSKIDRSTLYILRFGEAIEMRKKGDTNAAEALICGAIQEYPDRYEGYVLLADIRLQRGETNRAIASYEAALKYAGSSPTNLVQLTFQQQERSRIQHVLKTLRQ